jgi:hypothetical protein
VSDLLNFLASLPVGYMFAYPGTDMPEDYMEVNGQRLSKEQYFILHQVLLGNVVDDGSYFILPKSSEISPMFNVPNTKIIVKFR